MAAAAAARIVRRIRRRGDGKLARHRRRSGHRARLPALLRAAGFRIADLRPLVFTTTPQDFVWQWPATFFTSGLNRLVEIGAVGRGRAMAMRTDSPPPPAIETP